MKPNENLIGAMDRYNDAQAMEAAGPGIAIASVIGDKIEDVIKNISGNKDDKNDDEKDNSAFALRSGNSPLFKMMGSKYKYKK